MSGLEYTHKDHLNLFNICETEIFQLLFWYSILYIYGEYSPFHMNKLMPAYGCTDIGVILNISEPSAYHQLSNCQNSKFVLIWLFPQLIDALCEDQPFVFKSQPLTVTYHHLISCQINLRNLQRLKREDKKVCLPFFRVFSFRFSSKNSVLRIKSSLREFQQNMFQNG